MPNATTTSGMALAGRGFLAWYNARRHPTPTASKRSARGDLRGERLHGAGHRGRKSRRPGPRPRALKFGAGDCFWVGPLLTYWFNVMERPARAGAGARRRSS